MADKISPAFKKALAAKRQSRFRQYSEATAPAAQEAWNQIHPLNMPTKGQRVAEFLAPLVKDIGSAGYLAARAGGQGVAGVEDAAANLMNHFQAWPIDSRQHREEMGFEGQTVPERTRDPFKTFPVAHGLVSSETPTSMDQSKSHVIKLAEMLRRGPAPLYGLNWHGPGGHGGHVDLSPVQQAVLDRIAQGEGQIPGVSRDASYHELVGGHTPEGANIAPQQIADLSARPNIEVTQGHNPSSHAFGRYQFQPGNPNLRAIQGRSQRSDVLPDVQDAAAAYDAWHLYKHQTGRDLWDDAYKNKIDFSPGIWKGEWASFDGSKEGPLRVATLPTPSERFRSDPGDDSHSNMPPAAAFSPIPQPIDENGEPLVPLNVEQTGSPPVLGVPLSRYPKIIQRGAAKRLAPMLRYLP